MLYIKQLYNHDPKNGVIGDCYRTAIACLLDMMPDDVPHFGKGDFDIDGNCREHTQAIEAEVWLNSLGIFTINIPFNCDSVSSMLECIGYNHPNLYWLLGARSERKVNHAVVCCGGRIVHDPSRIGGDLIGPCTDGYYWATFFTSKKFINCE